MYKTQVRTKTVPSFVPIMKPKHDSVKVNITDHKDEPKFSSERLPILKKADSIDRDLVYISLK